jgi:hypothetical protein
MKRIIVSTLVFLLIHQVNSLAQDNIAPLRNPKLGITISTFGQNDLLRFEEIEGLGYYTGNGLVAVGLTYIFPITNWLELETGVEYLRSHIYYDNSALNGRGFNYNSNNYNSKSDFFLLEFPLTVRVNFLKHFFLNGGMFYEVDASNNSPIDNQTGFGSVFGISAKYDFKNRISVFFNPYGKIHSTIRVSDYSENKRMWENGIRIGCTYTMMQK